MFIHCELIVLVLALTLDGRVHSAGIIGGREAVPHSRPYMALLKVKTNAGELHCDGFLLNKNFVMTAAHCQGSFYEVFLGLHSFEKRNEAQRVYVAQAFPHKGYNSKTYKNDIMLLKLTSEAIFSQSVKPIALADRRGDSLPKSCLVSGWGATDKKDKYMSDKLMEVNVTLIKDARCDAENMYCSAGETGPDEGDSGGPLVCEDGKAYGVVSFTYVPRSGGQPTKCYAKIPDLKSWIDLTIKNAVAQLECNLTMFIRLVVLILALTLDCRVHTGEIIGGKKAVPHSRPYMVFLERLHENNSKTHCDGFLLNEEFVVTAAHCKAKSYIAWLGADNIQSRNDMQRVSVEKDFPHKDYSPAPNLKNDIMLLKLSSKVNFTENVTSIALGDRVDGPLPNSCLVSGWGLTGEDNYLSDVLMEVNVTLSDDKRCDGESWYCSVGNTGPAQGDSGGPLVCEDGKAYGVVSYKKNPETTDELPLYVFTKIPDYISWINSTISPIEHHGKK
ncbi:uncharacterized protein [Pagrus major]|uniref:uncharacterized protein n=1 Tax=Pagrus major TaxID=143350 RepID=UPI003CC8A47D